MVVLRETDPLLILILQTCHSSLIQLSGQPLRLIRGEEGTNVSQRLPHYFTIFTQISHQNVA